MDPVKLTNTEKLALGRILSDEEAAERKVRLLRKAFDDDLRARLGVGPTGTLRVDITAGTVEHLTGDSVPN